MVDVTDVPGVAVGDEVVLLGRQGESIITPQDLAGWAGSIPYELLCGISRRVPRIYLQDQSGAAAAAVGHGMDGAG